mgnify:CR=1 FL=1
MSNLSWRSDSVDETIRFGRLLAQRLVPGDVLILTGDLGAGKTQLTKGIAAGLGVAEDVTSPTFTIEMVYKGTQMPLYHFDLYRLDDACQLEDTGLFDALDADGICVIEWGEQFAEDIGEERLDICISRLDSEVGEGQEPPREIRLDPNGRRAHEIALGL